MRYPAGKGLFAGFLTEFFGDEVGDTGHKELHDGEAKEVGGQGCGFGTEDGFAVGVTVENPSDCAEAHNDSAAGCVAESDEGSNGNHGQGDQLFGSREVQPEKVEAGATQCDWF